MFLKVWYLFKYKITFLLVLISPLSLYPTFSQVIKINEIKEILEELYEATGNPVKYEDIKFYINNPKLLEKFSSNELSSILGISTQLAKEIKKTFKKTKKLEDICNSFNLLPSQCNLLKLIVSHEEQHSELNNPSSVEIKILSRFQYLTEKGIQEKLVNQIDSYQKLFISSSILDIGISISKDPGEFNFFGPKKFFFKKEFLNSSLLFGNFRVENANGIIIWSPFSTSKTPLSILTLTSNELFIQPTLSTTNYGNFLGFAGTHSFKLARNLLLHMGFFISKIPRSGSLDSLGNTITAFYTSDVFRTEKELGNRNNINENAIFGTFRLNTSKFSVSYSQLYLNYNKNVKTISKKFISGLSANLHSFHIKFNLFESVRFINEFALSQFSEVAWTNTLLFSKNKLTTLLNFRYFSPNFHSPFGTNFGENSFPNNELGILFSATFKLNSATFQILLDHFKSLQPTPNLQVPMYGNEFYFQTLIPLYEMKARVKVQRKEKTNYILNISNTKQIPYQKIQYHLMGEITYPASKQLILLSRFDFTKIKNQGVLHDEKGINLIFEINYNVTQNLKFGTRIDHYSTTSFKSAIYIFEYFAPGLMESIPYYGKGTKIIVWSKLKILDNRIQTYFRYYFDGKVPQKHFFMSQVDINLSF